MEKVFLTFLEVSAGTAAVILPLCLFSSAINRAFVARWKYWVWALLALRLLIPWNPDFEAAPPRVQVSIPHVVIGAPAPVQGTPVANAPVPIPAAPAPRSITVLEAMTWLWLAGAALFFVWQMASYLHFRFRVLRWGCQTPSATASWASLQKVRTEMGIKTPVRLVTHEGAPSPMVLGFFRPVLVLPQKEYGGEELGFILRHELTHYKRRDIWYKTLMLAACAVHWFNPAVWLMVRYAQRDLEISCDAAVMQGADRETRRRYSEAILANIRRRSLSGTALSTHFYGGKKAMKERFANIISTKKRRAGVLVFTAVLVSAALVGSLVACSARQEEPVPEEGGVSQGEDGFSVEAALEGITLEAYPHSSEDAIRQFQEYIRSLSAEEAKMILEDEQLVYSMLLDSYWAQEPENFYAIAATSSDYAPDQSMMPQESRWAGEAERRRMQELLDRLDMDVVDNVCAVSIPDDVSVSVQLTYGQVKEMIDRLSGVQLATCEPQNPYTGGYFSLYLLGPSGALTVGFDGGLLTLWARGEEAAWIFDGESCSETLNDIWGTVGVALEPARMAAQEAANAPIEELSPQQVAYYNGLFEPVLDGTTADGLPASPRYCFLSSYYDSVTAMSLAEFLRYFPGGDIVEDEAEFAALRAHPDFPFQSAVSLSEMMVPVHKFTAGRIDAVLSEYAGITLRDMPGAGESSPELIYLEEYDAYYNFTSDAGFAALNCVGGERQGDTIRLYGEIQNRTQTVLTLRDMGDGRELIVSYQLTRA